MGQRTADSGLSQVPVAIVDVDCVCVTGNERGDWLYRDYLYVAK